MRLFATILPLEWLIPGRAVALHLEYVGTGLYLRGRVDDEPLRLSELAKRIFLAFDGSRSVARIAGELAAEMANSALTVQRETLHLMTELSARGWASWQILKRK